MPRSTQRIEASPRSRSKLIMLVHLGKLALIRFQSLGDAVFQGKFRRLRAVCQLLFRCLMPAAAETHWTLSLSFLISSTTHFSLRPTSRSRSSTSRSRSRSRFLRSSSLSHSSRFISSWSASWECPPDPPWSIEGVLGAQAGQGAAFSLEFSACSRSRRRSECVSACSSVLSSACQLSCH